MIVLVDGIKYRLINPESEAWLEKRIEENYQHVFGDNSIYFPKKKIKSKAGIGTIPDAYLIIPGKKLMWCILEVELASHSVYDHVFPQLTKFRRAIEDSASRKTIRDFFYNTITADQVLEAQFRKQIGTGEIYKTLSDMVDEKPLIVVAIDQRTDALEEALLDFGGDVKVIEFKTYRREGVSDEINAYVFEPVFSEPPPPIFAQKPVSNVPTKAKYSEFWEPIRCEGLFAGKPVPIKDEGWIGKRIKGINIILKLLNHKCSILLALKGPDRTDRRDKVTKLFPKTKYEYEVRESPKFATIEFPVLDKGKKDREHWPEIRENLTKLGADIYNKIEESDI